MSDPKTDGNDRSPGLGVAVAASVSFSLHADAEGYETPSFGTAYRAIRSDSA